MAKPVGKTRGIDGKAPADQQQGADEGQQPLRPRANYKVRGQGLEDLPNSDLMPSPEDSKKATKPRQITDSSAAAGKGPSKALIFAGIAAVVVVVGGFLVMSGDDPAPAAVVAAAEPPAPAPIAPPPAEPAPVVAAAPEPTPAEIVPDAMTTAPAALASAPAPVSQDLPRPSDATDPAPALLVTVAPDLALTATAPTPFTCQDCSFVIPELADLTVVLFQPAGIMPWEAAGRLSALGVGGVAMSEAAIPVVENQVRYYSEDDLGAAQILADRYGATLVDLTWYDPAPAASNLDLWLAE